MRYVDQIRDVLDLYAYEQRVTESQVRLQFAELFLAELLGEDWLSAHLSDHHESNPVQNALFRYRIWQLGTLLFSFQSYEWFSMLVLDIQTRTLPGAQFEAEVVKLLMLIALPVKLRERTGIRGEDYDIDLGGGALHVAVEVKARDDDATYSQESLLGTLRTARKQLPKHAPGMIFLRVPLSWVAEMTRQPSSVDSAVADFLRNTTRVCAVAVVWDRLTWPSATTAHFESEQRIYTNEAVPESVSQMLYVLSESWAQELDIFGPATPF